MSFTAGGIAIKGYFTSEWSQIFKLFRRTDLNNDLIFENWAEAKNLLQKEASKEIYDGKSKWIVWQSNGWAIIDDSDFVLFAEEDTLLELSRFFNTQVIAFLVQETSDSIGFICVERSVKRRHFLKIEGVVTEDNGIPLSEEGTFPLSQRSYTEELFTLLKAIEIDYTNVTCIRKFIVKEL